MSAATPTASQTPPPLDVRRPVLDLQDPAAAAGARGALAPAAAPNDAAATATAAVATAKPKRERPVAVAAPVQLSVAAITVVVYNGAQHCWTRRDEWPVLSGSRATLQDVWALVRSNRAQEDATGRVHFERVQVDSIAVKADAKAIDWQHCALTDAANDVLSQYTFLQFNVTDLNEAEADADADADADDDGGADHADGDGTGTEGGSTGSTVTATGAAGALASGDVGLLDGRRRGATRAVYRGYNARRGTRTGRGGASALPEADHALPSSAPLLCGGRARWLLLLLFSAVCVLYAAYCLRVFVLYRPMAAHCGAFSDVDCANATNPDTDMCWEYAGECYPTDPVYTAAEAAGFGFAFLLVTVLFVIGSSLFGRPVARSWCPCTWVWSVMACAFTLLSAHYSFQAAERAAAADDADAMLLPRGWTHFLNATAWLLPVTVAAWINRGTVCCPC